MILSDLYPRFQGQDIIRRQITRKWYKIERTMADQQKVVYGPWNSTIFNDLERPLTQFSMSRHSLMLDISTPAKIRP